MNVQMKRVVKPWGYELIWGHTDKYVGKILHINAGQALSLQYHNIKDETIMVQYGRIQLEYFTASEGVKNKHILDMVPGDSFHIKPGLRHRMIACQDADIVEVSTPELDDVVRLEDRYGRTKPKTEQRQSFIRRLLNLVFRR
jgi:mannose-6-phosphate isomerase-like protein (cupin superfamily)